MAECGSSGQLTTGEAMWEFYLTDPENEPDPAKWQTRVVRPTA